MSGGPAWLDADGFDIVARTSDTPHHGDEPASLKMTVGAGSATLSGVNVPMNRLAENLSQFLIIRASPC